MRGKFKTAAWHTAATVTATAIATATTVSGASRAGRASASGASRASSQELCMSGRHFELAVIELVSVVAMVHNMEEAAVDTVVAEFDYL